MHDHGWPAAHLLGAAKRTFAPAVADPPGAARGATAHWQGATSQRDMIVALGHANTPQK